MAVFIKWDRVTQKGGGAPSPIFGPCLLWPNRWMDQDGTWHGCQPWSKPHCARWGTSSPFPKKGTKPPSGFSAHFYSARNARIASVVLATAIPSVCLSVRPSLCPSVTRRYCVKTTARSTVQFAPLELHRWIARYV